MKALRKFLRWWRGEGETEEAEESPPYTITVYDPRNHRLIYYDDRHETIYKYVNAPE